MKLATHSTILTGTPTISILTTVYNREKYLAECIESVQNGHFQDYEHIIVDDGSTDGSVALAQAMPPRTLAFACIKTKQT